MKEQAGNDQYDRERAEAAAKAKVESLKKLEELNKKQTAIDSKPDESSNSSGKRSKPVEAEAVEAHQPKKRKHDGKQDYDKHKSSRKVKSDRVPLGHKAAFEKLLKGPLPKRDQ
jgi:spore germination protein GerM